MKQASIPVTYQMSSATMNNVDCSVYKKRVEGFFRVFYPFKSEEDVQKVVDMGVPLDKLYEKLMNERFIPLKDQEDVYFPTQRSKEWFDERERIESTVTGSKPSGWYFGISNPESYKEELAYLHLGKKKVFSKEAIARMKKGVKYEDLAASRFLEFFTTEFKTNMYIYETGFQRNSEIPYLGASPDGLVASYFKGVIFASRDCREETEYLVAYTDEEGESDTYVIRGFERYDCALKNATKFKDQSDWDHMKACEYELPRFGGWKKTKALEAVYGARFSVLEIKCPSKGVPSFIPYYYMCQLHCEMASFNMTEAFFLCWHYDEKKGTERLRVWKLKFNNQFWQDFLKIVEIFRMKNSDSSRGAPWSVFGHTWFKFKIMYSKRDIWTPYVKPYYAPRKYCIERPYDGKI